MTFNEKHPPTHSEKEVELLLNIARVERKTWISDNQHLPPLVKAAMIMKTPKANKYLLVNA